MIKSRIPLSDDPEMRTATRFSTPPRFSGSARSLLAILGLTMGLVACGIPVSEDKQLYVGQWNDARTSLRIDADGTVSYERRVNPGQVTINAPIQEFRGNDFLVGLPGLTTTFEVSRPPWFEDGSWRMVVDGAELVRAD